MRNTITTLQRTELLLSNTLVEKISGDIINNIEQKFFIKLLWNEKLFSLSAFTSLQMEHIVRKDNRPTWRFHCGIIKWVILMYRLGCNVNPNKLPCQNLDFTNLLLKVQLWEVHENRARIRKYRLLEGNIPTYSLCNRQPMREYEIMIYPYYYTSGRM